MTRVYLNNVERKFLTMTDKECRRKVNEYRRAVEEVSNVWRNAIEAVIEAHAQEPGAGVVVRPVVEDGSIVAIEWVEDNEEETCQNLETNLAKPASIV